MIGRFSRLGKATGVKPAIARMDPQVSDTEASQQLTITIVSANLSFCYSHSAPSKYPWKATRARELV
jgi:hypothetical protein